MRIVFGLLHRWLGLVMAAFLCVSGITGAIISWDHELDDLLNAHLTEARAEGPPLSSFAMAAMIEQRDPRAWAAFIPLHPEPGESLNFGVVPRIDPATSAPYELGYNEVFVDPATGAELGRRDWGAVWPLSRENFVSFLYVLHYSLHIPRMWDIDEWGTWLMGVIALIWTVDCFIGFYITLPNRRAAAAAAAESGRGWWARWKPAWKIKTSGSAYRINFDIHRAGALWLWIVLFILAFSSLSLNMHDEVVEPLVASFSDLKQSAFDAREEKPRSEPIAPKLTFPEILAIGRDEAARRGWTEPPQWVNYAALHGIYSIGFYEPGEDHGFAGGGTRSMDFDGQDGRYLGEDIPWTGSAGDLFLQAQFPLHSGRIAGIPGRIFVSFMGIAVTVLSVTGVVIWYRKRIARLRRTRNAAAPTQGVQAQPGN